MINVVAQIMKSENKYYSVILLYELARVLPHSILSIYLLSKGLGLGEIAILQTFFMAAIVLFEFPSGILSDFFDKKNMYILSIVLILLSYLTIYFVDDFILLCISWALYGLATALKSGTMEVIYINSYKANSDHEGMKIFISNSSFYVNVGAIIGGLFGSFIYKIRGNDIYLIAVLIFAISLIISAVFLPNSKPDKERTKIQEKLIKTHFRNIVKGLNNRNLLVILLLLCFIQFFMQPFYNYWQVMFEDFNYKISFFGIIYIYFRFISMISARIFKKYNLTKIKNLQLYILILVTCVLLSSYFYIDNISFVIYITTLNLAFGIYSLYLEFSLVNEIEQDIMSSMISLVGTFIRIFSIVVLILTAWMLEKYDIFLIFGINISIFVVLSIILSIIKLAIKKIDA